MRLFLTRVGRINDIRYGLFCQGESVDITRRMEYEKKRAKVLLLDCDMSISAYIDNWVKQEILFLCYYYVLYSTKVSLDLLKVGNW